MEDFLHVKNHLLEDPPIWFSILQFWNGNNQLCRFHGHEMESSLEVHGLCCGCCFGRVPVVHCYATGTP